MLQRAYWAPITYCRVSPFSPLEVAALFIAPCTNQIPLAYMHQYLSRQATCGIQTP